MYIAQLQQCQDCLAHYSGTHTCPPFMRALKKMHDDIMREKGIEKCLICYTDLVPDMEAKNTEGVWDGHTWKFACDCIKDKNIRISIG